MDWRITVCSHFTAMGDRIWIGTADGVSLFQNGRFERALTASDGLNSNNISAIAEVGGMLWFGSGDNGGGKCLQSGAGSASYANYRWTPKTVKLLGDTSVVFKFEGGDASTPTGSFVMSINLTMDHLPPPTIRVAINGRYYQVLQRGDIALVVYAIDRENNSDTTGAEAEFVVDSLPPSVSITAPQSKRCDWRCL